MKTLVTASAAIALSLAAVQSLAQDACANRGELDALYCDENGDLVADTPKDPRKLKNPSTLVFTYTPVEDPAVYENIFKPFTDYLSKCTGKRVVFYQVQSNASEIEAMRSRLWLIVKKDSPFQKIAELKGKKVAHVQPSSNSGNLAPRALFPALGLVP